MVINCRDCGFATHTSGEGFGFSPQNVNFCMKCGCNFRASGIEIDGPMERERAAGEWGFRAFIRYICTPMVAIVGTIFFDVAMGFPLRSPQLDFLFYLFFAIPLMGVPILLWIRYRKFYRSSDIQKAS